MFFRDSLSITGLASLMLRLALPWTATSWSLCHGTTTSGDTG